MTESVQNPVTCEELAQHFANRRVGGVALTQNEDDYTEAEAILAQFIVLHPAPVAIEQVPTAKCEFCGCKVYNGDERDKYYRCGICGSEDTVPIEHPLAEMFPGTLDALNSLSIRTADDSPKETK